jgi:hypothetical protein
MDALIRHARWAVAGIQGAIFLQRQARMHDLVPRAFRCLFGHHAIRRTTQLGRAMCASRQTTAVQQWNHHTLFMKELLQQIGPDYYRFVQLLIAHAELKHLRQWRVDVKRRSNIPLGMSRTPDKSRADPPIAINISAVQLRSDQLRGPRARPPLRGTTLKSKSHRYPAQDFPIKQALPSNRDRTPSGPTAE